MDFEILKFPVALAGGAATYALIEWVRCSIAVAERARQERTGIAKGNTWDLWLRIASLTLPLIVIPILLFVVLR